MDPLNYLDFELKIDPEAGGGYVARVLRSPVGEASCRFQIPFSEDRLALLTLKLSRPRATTRSMRTPELTAAREFGGTLFDAVFSDDVRACLRSSLDEAARREDTGLRIRLRLQDAPELADLPWEFLFDPSLGRFLTQSNRTPVVRYLELPERIRPLAVQLPLNLLVMISSPRDPAYLRLDVEREETLLRRALQPLHDLGRVKIDWLEGATLAALQRRLRAGRYHILHFIGHGGFDERTEEGVLVLEDQEGGGWLADAARIATILHDHPSLRLVVLNACEGARNSRRDPFAGVATTLIRHGVPAVVAMQFEITDEAAIIFSGEFYAAVAEGHPVDAAVAEARKAIFAQPNDVEWGTPVLYTRAPDGVLFEVQDGPAAAPPPLRPPAPQAAARGKPAAAPFEAAVAAWLRQARISWGEMKVEASLQVDVPEPVLRNRVMRWAETAGFKIEAEQPGFWKLRRGTPSLSLRPHPRDVQARAVIRADGEGPRTVSCSLSVFQSLTVWDAKDRQYVAEQFLLLGECLAGSRP